VYRLICENTVEERVLQLAQRKLQLDSMVTAKKATTDSASERMLTTAQLLSMVRFGADKIAQDHAPYVAGYASTRS